MSPSVIFLFALSISTEIAREICFKIGADKTNSQHAGSSYLPAVLGSHVIWLGFLFWGIEIIAWINVLARVPLNIAFPIMSLCYVGTLIAGKYILGEKISKHKWIGAVLITVGVVVIGSI